MEPSSLNQLRKKLEELQKERLVVLKKKTRLLTKRGVLEGICKNISENSKCSTCQKPNKTAFDESSLSDVTNLLTFYENEASKLDEELLDVDKTLKHLNEEIQILEQNIKNSSAEEANSNLTRYNLKIEQNNS